VVLIPDSASCHKGSEIEKALQKSNIEAVYISGGCTSFLQPLDVSLNKQLKDKILKFYLEWLSDMKKKILDNIPQNIDSNYDSNESDEESEDNSADDAFTNAGYLRAPTYTDYRNWFSNATSLLCKQMIKNSFAICGISFGLSDLVHLNKKIRDSFQDLIETFNQETNDKEYLDHLEQQLIDFDDQIISQDEATTEDEEEISLSDAESSDL